ncbi:hypothetical protein QEZ54_08815 [Catellatospora sp. KI3]|uniref:hypothetical protein n=1 Tax=Catellatospora sp. KI3 TaxID=3041620 RepID=UPI00248233D1|nr:hypothetical protein [Catellatospora sp. KI3]MDI1461063.1 hypothetical protein [Catellatospora sp. KI3]
MSRQELADACNAVLARTYAERGGGQRWAGLTERTIGALERGEIRWPNENYRRALCVVLGADERDIGLYIDRPAEHGADFGKPESDFAPVRSDDDHDGLRQSGAVPDALFTPDQWRARMWNSLLHPANAEPVSAHDLQAGVVYGNLAYQKAWYNELHQLPTLISRAEALFQDAVSGTIPRAVKAVCGVYLLASKFAAKLGDGELAWVTAERARCFGLVAADSLSVAMAAYQTACALAKQPGRAAEAESVAAAAADVIATHKQHRTAAYLSAQGALLLHAAFSAALRRDSRAAGRYIQTADSVASQLGRNGNELWTAFGPANVHLHRISVAVALDDNPTALGFADRMDTSQLPSVLTSRRAQVHLDLAMAHGASGNSDPQATLHLLEYERIVPQAITLNATAGQLITTLIRRERASQTPGLRSLAQRAGVAEA